MNEEIFYLAWHLHWSPDEILALDVARRHGFVEMVSQRIAAEGRRV